MRHAHLKLDLFFELLYLLVDLTEVLSIFIEFHIEVKLSPCSIVPSSFQYINKCISKYYQYLQQQQSNTDKTEAFQWRCCVKRFSDFSKFTRKPCP